MSTLPMTTRLRYVKAKEASTLTLFCDTLGARIEIKSIVKDGTYWVLWFIPDDKGRDVKSGEIKIGQNAKGQKAIGYVRN